MNALKMVGHTCERFAQTLTRNGQKFSGYSKEHLLESNSGGYTVARTVNQTSIFELQMHCTRLYQFFSAKHAPDNTTSTSTPPSWEKACTFVSGHSVESWRRFVCSGIKPALDHVIKDCHDTIEYQITLFMTCDTVGSHTPPYQGFDFYTYVKPLPHFEAMVDVEAADGVRSNPTIKDTQWVKERKNLEEIQREAGVDEVIMINSDGSISEGLQTNFFAVSRAGVIQTAPSDLVLSGTVRKVVIEVAKDNNIPLEFQCPRITDASTWDSCFICSTSRLVKPIRELRRSRDVVQRWPAENTVAHKVADLVLGSFQAHAENVDVMEQDC